MIELVALLLVIGITLAVAAEEFVERCVGLKLAGDSLAILVLAFGGQNDNGDIRAASLAIIALTTGLIFLLIVVGRRHFSQKSQRSL